MRGRRAFTMIEMLCVVVILAIAAAMVCAEMSNTGYVQAEAAARNVVSDLILAQNTAIATQQPVYVTFNTGSNASAGVAADSYALCSAISPSAVCLTNPLTQQAYTNSWATANWSVSSVSFNSGSSMDFNCLGTPESTPGTTLVNASTGYSTVNITSQGYTFTIKIQDYTGDITVQDQ